MKLLNTYTDQAEAEAALEKITGRKRMASERDSTDVIYNLFGQPTWTNFYRLGMFKLPRLQEILDDRKNGRSYDQEEYRRIIGVVRYAGGSFGLEVPGHWL